MPHSPPPSMPPSPTPTPGEFAAAVVTSCCAPNTVVPSHCAPNTVVPSCRAPHTVVTSGYNSVIVVGATAQSSVNAGIGLKVNLTKMIDVILRHCNHIVVRSSIICPQ
ncbi:hypothetical protein GUJ93_ZPchr0013g34216 [Zizania palustris]|uniref:Hydrophobic seed protein domain-containing protein n=1 Tax=Zizania palustris TaxID=103762 RepID=A0A8J6BYM8_ZIZPA|nr:hypothetical protein GUJ93_ZPchr0013g34216 [Zizania palustris]